MRPGLTRNTAGLLIALLCAIWGSTWIVIQRGLRDLPPFTSAGCRFLVAAVVMAIATPFVRRREGGANPPTWLALVVGLLSFGASYALVYWSETRLPSGLSSVLWSIFPLLIALASHFFLPDGRLSARKWLGFAAGFVGVALLFATDIRDAGPASVPAALWLCLSPVCAAIGTIAVKRHGAGTSSVVLNRNALAIGAVVLCAAAWLFERDARATWTPAAIASVVYLALVGTALTFGLYFWLLRHMPAHKLSLISYVTPAIALLVGTVIGEEPFTLFTCLGSASILTGVWLVVRAPPPADVAGVAGVAGVARKGVIVGTGSTESEQK